VGDEANILHAASNLLSRIYPRERVEKALEDLAAETARETTTRATAEPRPHWKDAARAGGDDLATALPQLLVAFIKREFELELANSTMIRPMLNRYAGLYQDYCNHRHQLPPELKSIPKKGEFNDRLVVEGKVTSEDAVRSAERDRKRVARAVARRLKNCPTNL
jgi:hypothetical protein